jgi:hypothetical protein
VNGSGDTLLPSTCFSTARSSVSARVSNRLWPECAVDPQRAARSLYNPFIATVCNSYRFFTPPLLSPRAQLSSNAETPMLDIAMLLLGIGFFAASAAYAYACDRL